MLACPLRGAGRLILSMYFLLWLPDWKRLRAWRTAPHGPSAGFVPKLTPGLEAGQKDQLISAQVAARFCDVANRRWGISG